MTDNMENMKEDISGTLEGSVLRFHKVNSLVVLIIAGLTLLFILGLGGALLQTNLAQISSGAAPDFRLSLFDGRSFTLSEQRGKVVLINFWASWCGPCRVEAPELNAIWSEYKDRDVIMVGVDYLDTESDARAFLKEFSVQYLNGPDFQTRIAADYRVKAVPETYIVDKQGNLAKTFPGPITAAILRPILDRLLSQQ